MGDTKLGVVGGRGRELEFRIPAPLPHPATARAKEVETISRGPVSQAKEFN